MAMIRKNAGKIVFATIARKVAGALVMGTSVAALNYSTALTAEINIEATPYTPVSSNYSGKTIAVGSNIVNLSGSSSWTGSSAVNVLQLYLDQAYNAGYVTGGINPNGKFTLNNGPQNNGVAVFDPITNSYATVNTYSTSGLVQARSGSNGAFAFFYLPTPAGSGPFIGAQIATVSGGGTLNVNMTGVVGDNSVKDTVYVKVTDGVANWNSVNVIDFARPGSDLTEAMLQPYAKDAVLTSYNGTFNVTDANGITTTHSVTDLTSYQVYNDWLIQQLQAGNFGNASVAQTAYNNAVALAYTDTTHTYNVNPQAAPIDPATDPMLKPSGTRIAMLADGATAVAHVGATGGLITAQYDGTVLLQAKNGGTVINDGLVDSHQASRGIVVQSGGHAINNGVRVFQPRSVSDLTAPQADLVSGAGSTYINNGTVNLSPHISPVATSNGMWLNISGDHTGGSAVNHGAVNIGTRVQLGQGFSIGVQVSDHGSFINDSDGLIYFGREASSITTGDVMARGGADVALANGAIGIRGYSGSSSENKGTIIIGDLVQNAYGLWAASEAAPLSMINSGTIEVRGHYNATPQANVGIYSANSSASSVINNSGAINLTGVNVIAIKAQAGGKAQSSGVIDITAGADPASGLRNYGIWSEGSGSRVDLSGTINLAGDGAIGAHARSSGSVAISGDGQVVFSSGTSQIGYFVYGAGASITNTGTGTQDVSTERSVLFRMEDGADFTGGIGTTSTLTASGKNATAVVVTGRAGVDVSAFNSGGMTINATGEGALGVLVEGGAQGKISSAAVINLTGIGSIAGIADGQKHALDGSNSNAPIAGALSNGALAAGSAGFGTGTLLVAQANLNSALDQVTGYIARNGASLNNSGNIVFTGANTTGIRVEEGSTGGNSGSITVQDGGLGLIAASSGAATTLNNTGTLTLKGGTNANRTTGISATGSAVTVNMTAGLIDLQGQGAIGVSAYEGATVNLAGTAVPKFAANGSGITDQVAFLISGTGSSITTDVPAGTVLDSSGTNATLFRVAGGATQSGVLQMKTSGTGARGIWATGDGTRVTAAAGSDFQVLGVNAMAVLVQGGAHATLAAGSTVTLVGDGAIVGQVDGNEYAIDGTTVIRSNTNAQLINNATLSSPLSNATGFVTQNQGLLINNGIIDLTTGANNTGVAVKNGKFENHANITVNGVAVDVTGANAVVDVQAGQIKASDGIAAIRLGAGASLNLVGSGIGTVTAGGTAHGVLVDNGAAGLVIAGAHIDMASAGAGTGNGVENKAEIAGIQLTSTTVIDVMNGKGVRTSAALAVDNSGTINVMGSGTGLAFETETGGTFTNNVDLSQSSALTINVTGTNGTGISVNHAGNGDVNNAANVIVAGGGGSAVKLVGVATFTNSGNLDSNSSISPVIALGTTTSVTNTATGQIGSATGTALSFDGQNSTLDNAGLISGIVAINAGNNTVTNSGTISGNVTASDGANGVTNSGTIAGDIVAGNGNNSVTNAVAATIIGDVIAGHGNNVAINSGTIAGDITFGDGTNNTTLNAGSSVVHVTGGTGVNNVTVYGNATFTRLDGGVGGGLDNVTFDGVTRTLTSISLNHYETMVLRNATTLTTADVIQMTDMVGGVGAIAIDATSRLAITAPTGYTLNHAMTGTGVISAQMASITDAFNFGANAGNAFAGMVQMGQGALALSGANTTALTAATLRVDTGSTTTVGAGNQAIGGLTFNGGTMVFDATIPAQTVATGYITAGKLDISGTGTVKVNIPTGFDNTQPVPNTSAPLLQQDDTMAMTKLVGSSNVTGTGGQLTLVDQNGVVISDDKVLDINQNSTKVAEGVYDYRMLSSSNGGTPDGLYVGYGLTEVKLIGTATNALILTPAAGATGLATDLSAKVSGTGDLAIMAGAGKTVSLSNGGNTYSGATGVVTGTLKMAANNVLGTTSSLNVAGGAAFDTAGFSQSVGAVNTALGGKVTIAAGSTLTIVDTQRTAGNMVGGTLRGNTLFGGGRFVIDPSLYLADGEQSGYTGQLDVTAGSQLVVNTANAFDNAAGIGLIGADDKLTFGNLSSYGDTATATAIGTAAVKLSGVGIVETRDLSDVTLSGDNTPFAGKFDVGTDTFLRASEAKNLGTASVLADGTFNAIATADWQLNNAVTNTVAEVGTVLKTGAGVLTVDQSLAAFTGLTDVQAGTLVVGNDTMSGSLVGGKGNVAAGAILTGNGKIAGDVTNAGTISALNAQTAYASAPAGNFTIGGVLTNSGTVQLGGATVGNTITVGGIVGDGGTFVLHTVLGNDSSATDKIIVNGGTVTGSNFLSIVNQGGLGAQTTGNGIEVVSAINGATTVAGSFELTGRVAAGAYEYDLKRGDASAAGDSWYLRTLTADPVTPVTPETPVTPDTPVTPVTPVVTDGMRPEVPTNAAIMPLAAEFGYAMLGTLHERTGGAFVSAKTVYEERTVYCKDAAQNFRCVVRTPLQGNDSQGVMAGGWARIFADRGLRGEGNFARHGSDYDYTLGGAQAGLDIYTREARDGSLDKAGIYLGYGQVEADIKGIETGRAGTVDMNGYSVGAYWTHYAASGWYSDAVIQGTWYNADARSIKSEQVKPDGFGVLASLEGGYSFKLSNGWSLEPQAQVIYQMITFDNTQDHYGTFAFDDSDSVRARVGLRLARTFNNGTDQQPRMMIAWARANVWHEFAGKYEMTTATFSNSASVISSTNLGGTWGEIGAGVTAQVTEKINLFATGAYQHSLDGKDRQGWNGRLGVAVKW